MLDSPQRMNACVSWRGGGGGGKVTPFKGYEPRAIKGVFSEGQLSNVCIHRMFYIFDEYYSNIPHIYSQNEFLVPYIDVIVL